MATVLFDTAGQPVKLVLGVHGIQDPRKSTYYNTVDFSRAILPEAAPLLPLVKAGWARLYEVAKSPAVASNLRL